MNKEEIKEIVAETVDYLFLQGKLVDDDMNYKYMSKMLFKFYDGGTGSDDDIIRAAVQEQKKDEWFPIITLYYKDRMTVEGVADELCCDYSTIVRNKKRLVMLIYNRVYTSQ